MTPATLVLARHGRTPWHEENRYTGSSDIGIDEVGTEQATNLASWAGVSPPDALYASGLQRAMATAAPVAELLGLQLETDDRLREMHFGIAEGHTLDDLRVTHPAEVARFEADPAAHPLPGSEDPHEAADRGVEVLDGIAAAHGGHTVLVVCHNTLIRLVLCRYLGIPLGGYRTVLHGVAPTSAARLTVAGGKARLLSYNEDPRAAFSGGREHHSGATASATPPEHAP